MIIRVTPALVPVNEVNAHLCILINLLKVMFQINKVNFHILTIYLLMMKLILILSGKSNDITVF